MNKGDLINKVADDTELTKVQANEAIDSLLEAIAKTLKGGGKVTLVGFGTFSVSKRAARNGRNPKTGEEVEITPRRVLSFRASHVLKDKINRDAK